MCCVSTGSPLNDEAMENRPRRSIRARRPNSRVSGSNPELQHKVVQACHSSALGCHSGIPVTYMRIKKMFAWKGLKSDVDNLVKSCVTCQQAKPDITKLPGLLQPLPVPSSASQVISLDFVEGLPQSGNFNCILVVVDSFTKYGHFIPLNHPFTAASVAKAFLDHVYQLHGFLPLLYLTEIEY